MLNGINSDSIPVSSGVPQGSVLGPIFFLAYINDLPDQVKSCVRLFADDTVTAVYLAITSLSESEILQQDLTNLEHWEKLWDNHRTIIHWNALPAFIPLLPTLAQFSSAVCLVVHLSP